GNDADNGRESGQGRSLHAYDRWRSEPDPPNDSEQDVGIGCRRGDRPLAVCANSSRRRPGSGKVAARDFSCDAKGRAFQGRRPGLFRALLDWAGGLPPRTWRNCGDPSKKEPTVHDLPRRDAVFHAPELSRFWNARWLRAELSGITRLHSLAGRYGTQILLRNSSRDTRDRAIATN